MQQLNKTSDIERFQNYGNLTQPFLPKEFIYNQIMLDLKHKQKDPISYDFLISLALWIHHHVKYSSDDDIQQQKFMRTAKEIWESKKASGCTDYAVLFATFTRTLGIPTTFLHTAEYDWLKKLKSGESGRMHFGHSFCECFFGGGWVLVDPTCKRLDSSYNPEKLELSYTVGGKSIFIPYFRELDLGEKQDIETHNKMMDQLCNNIDI